MSSVDADVVVEVMECQFVRDTSVCLAHCEPGLSTHGVYLRDQIQIARGLIRPQAPFVARAFPLNIISVRNGTAPGMNVKGLDDLVTVC
jgi:hypothetical protein